MMKKRISFIAAFSIVRVTLAMMLAIIFLGCASSDRKPAGGIAYEYEPAETTRQNPNSYFMDGFNVQKERKSRPPTTAPFFFKHCDEGAGRGPWSSTTYECDYAM
jgi:hypothetical protein